jgi:hypothetical protein
MHSCTVTLITDIGGPFLGLREKGGTPTREAMNPQKIECKKNF